MILNRIEDPRDNLHKASRYELCVIAKHHGIADIGYGKDGQTLEDMIKILRDNGVRDIKIPERPLGVYKPVILNADDLIPPSAAHKHETVAKDDVSKSSSEMSITELRMECKKRGIKMARTDNMESLRAKLG